MDPGDQAVLAFAGPGLRTTAAAGLALALAEAVLSWGLTLEWQKGDFLLLSLQGLPPSGSAGLYGQASPRSQLETLMAMTCCDWP